MTTLANIIARLEAATDPHPHLNADIFFFFGGRARTLNGDPQWRWKDGPWKDGEYPDFLGSLDAAVALMERVLPGWSWSAGFYRSCNEAFGSVWPIEDGRDCTSIDAEAASPALSLCLALCRAKLAQEPSHD